MKTKQRVRADLLLHLQKVGFNTQAMEVDITQLTFDRNTAHASVSFRPQGASNIHDSMVMNYTMELRDGHWTVTGRGDSQGHGMGQAMPGAAQGQLPAGHPALGGGMAGQPGGSAGTGAPAQQLHLPEGHPALESMPPAANPAQPLPPGHPKMANPQPSSTTPPQSRNDPRRGWRNAGQDDLLAVAGEILAARQTGLAG